MCATRGHKISFDLMDRRRQAVASVTVICDRTGTVVRCDDQGKI